MLRFAELSITLGDTCVAQHGNRTVPPGHTTMAATADQETVALHCFLAV